VLDKGRVPSISNVCLWVVFISRCTGIRCHAANTCFFWVHVKGMVKGKGCVLMVEGGKISCWFERAAGAVPVAWSKHHHEISVYWTRKGN